jgi:hypothetical protein
MAAPTRAPAGTAANGSFSPHTRRAAAEVQPAAPPSRRRGYTSSTRSRPGTTMARALASRAAPARRTAAGRGPVGWAAYASNVRRTKQPDTTSRRSVTHATDSTRKGCTAQSSAPRAAAGPVTPGGRARQGEEPVRQEVEEHGVRHVPEHARQVIPRGVEPPQEVVHAQREPAEGLPVPEVERGAHPHECGRPETPETHVVDHVRLVVEVDERVLQRRREGERHAQRHTPRQEDGPEARGGEGEAGADIAPSSRPSGAALSTLVGPPALATPSPW